MNVSVSDVDLARRTHTVRAELEAEPARRVVWSEVVTIEKELR